MLWFIVLAVWCASGCARGAVPAHDKPVYPEATHALQFAAFKATYNKQYATPEEERHRFKKNLATINELNANDEHAVYDINEFADQSDEELEVSYIEDDQENKTTSCTIISEKNFPTDYPGSFDWRSKGVVTKVKDQKNCDAGYAFALVGAVESNYAMNFSKLVEFSTQQVIDCDKTNKGCKGGKTLAACGYLEKHGFIKEDIYKYVGSQGKCSYDKKNVFGRYAQCLISDMDEEFITGVLIRYGPWAAEIDSTALRFYRSGIMTQCTFKRYNNALLLIGYGVENGVPYWSLKNSKGEDWGEKGYVRIKRGVSCLGLSGKYKLVSVHYFYSITSV